MVSTVGGKRDDYYQLCFNFVPAWSHAFDDYNVKEGIRAWEVTTCDSCEWDEKQR